MFLYLLEDHQKAPFLELAQMLIKEDGRLSPEEISMLESMKKEMNITSAPKISGQSVEELASYFNTKRSKYVAAFELIGLGYADNEFVASEKALINKLFKRLQFSEAEMVTIENWVVRQLAMVREAESFWKE